MSPGTRTEFERVILPHLAAGYSLARWLLRHPHEAEDAVQDALLRAFKAFPGYAGDGAGARAWLLAIVRNTCLTSLERRRSESKVVLLADAAAGQDRLRERVADPAPLPEAALITEEERHRVMAAIAGLPAQFREVLIMREFHDMSYREISDVVGTPVGTVMSRLARARSKLAAELGERKTRPGAHTKP